MSQLQTILIIEDDDDLIVPLSDVVARHYEVEVAKDGWSGEDRAKEILPAAIILDVRLPGISGIEVCRHLKANPKTRHIPILMLTVLSDSSNKVQGLEAGADDYLTKPYDRNELIARINGLVRRSKAQPFPELTEECTLSLRLDANSRLIITADGKFKISTRASQIIDWEISKYRVKGDSIPYPKWQAQAEDVGDALFQKVFGSREVQRCYREALGLLGVEYSLLHLRFGSPSEVLGVPFETLYDKENDNFLALFHPISRFLTSVTTSKESITPKFINSLAANHERLRILLIASDTVPENLGPIPGADLEVDRLGKFLKPAFAERGIDVQVDVLTTAQASYGNVRKVLQNCGHNIVHYSGHGIFEHGDPDKGSPNKGSIFFWERENRGGDTKKVQVAEVGDWLRSSKVNFVYLSSCSSAQSSRKSPSSNSFVGMADGLIRAGVPAVLGFRWPVSDGGAIKLAQSFYKALAQHGRIHTALLDARKEAHVRDSDDNTWLSPVLISQG